MELYAVVVETKPVCVKYDQSVSVLPVWRDESQARAYVAKQPFRQVAEVTELTWEIFDQTKNWHTESGKKLYLNIL